MIKGKIKTKDVVKLFVCLFVISGIFLYETGSFMMLYVALVLGILFLISKKIIDWVLHNERVSQAVIDQKKCPTRSCNKRLLSVVFFVFSIGVPSVIFYTPLRYKISIKSFPWDCMFYEIIFIYVFVSTILQKRGIDDIRIFRKILIVSTILIFCFILVFFYFSDFDRGFIFLGGLTVIFSFRLYQRVKSTIP